MGYKGRYKDESTPFFCSFFKPLIDKICKNLQSENLGTKRERKREEREKREKEEERYTMDHQPSLRRADIDGLLGAVDVK